MASTNKSIEHLGVLLCYNDSDILEEALDYYLEQCDAVVAYDHGSTDETASILDKYRARLADCVFIPRDFDFYSIYGLVSVDLMHRWVPRCDWISWPDQDEFLEAPTRKQSYRTWIKQLIDSPYGYVKFHNYNFWFTSKDDSTQLRSTARIRHYARFPDCAPRIRSWRACGTNLRFFNHNALPGDPAQEMGNLRHYPARSYEQIVRRLERDRTGIQRGPSNTHYNAMASRKHLLRVAADALHVDDGTSPLDPTPKYNWRTLYGPHPPRYLPPKLLYAVRAAAKWSVPYRMKAVAHARPWILRVREQWGQAPR